MRKITEGKMREAVARLCRKANFHLRPDVQAALEKSFRRERSAQAKKILEDLLENAKIARRDDIALCQDTGLPVVFIEIGRDADICGVDIKSAVHAGVADGYEKGYLRNSVVPDPLLRLGGFRSSPAVLHFDFGKHKGLKITVLPKGFGCENKTKLKMFNPTASMDEIEDFLLEAVREAGPDACPPYIVGVGIGGGAETACSLAKKALLRPIDRQSNLPHVARLEKDLLKKANALGVGPMGLGGETTVLGVNILTYPTHIAGLPVCVNISCHVLRSASVILR